MGETIWSRDGTRWTPPAGWQAIYDAIEEYRSQGKHLYTEVEGVLALHALSLADAICAALSTPAEESSEQADDVVSWRYQYRNYSNHEWRTSHFHEATGGVPVSREDALERLKGFLGRWVPGTQFRLVEVTERTSISPPLGEFSPERVEQPAEARSEQVEGDR